MARKNCDTIGTMISIEKMLLIGLVAALVVGSASWANGTTITVDGTPEAAWGNSDVAYSPDVNTDEPNSDDNADVLGNYITDDGINFYFRFDVEGEIYGPSISTTWYVCDIFIDSDNNPATGATSADPWPSPSWISPGVGADYYVEIGGSEHTIWDRLLYSWNGSSWVNTGITPDAQISTSILEIGLALSAIGNPHITIAIGFYSEEGTTWTGDFNNDNGGSAILYTPISVTGINVDGVIGDWDGTETIDSDPNEMANPYTDILETGITSDASYLYIRMNSEGIALWETYWKNYVVWIDIDTTTTEGDSDPAGGGAWSDFYADYKIYVGGSGVTEKITEESYQYWTGSAWSGTPSADEPEFDAATGSNYIEFKIPRANIGYPNGTIEIGFDAWEANTSTDDCNNDCGTPAISYTFPITLSLSSSNNTFAFGTNPLNTWMTPQTSIITNDGNVPENFIGRISQFTAGSNTWDIDTLSNGADSVRAQWSITSETGPWTDISAYDTDFTIATNVAVNDSVNFWLRIQTPTSTSSYNEHSSTLTVTAQEY
jgi:hypothetical protein